MLLLAAITGIELGIIALLLSTLAGPALKRGWDAILPKSTEEKLLEEEFDFRKEEAGKEYQDKLKLRDAKARELEIIRKERMAEANIAETGRHFSEMKQNVAGASMNPAIRQSPYLLAQVMNIGD